MHIPRVFYGTHIASGVKLQLARDASDHLLRVLRLRQGDSLVIFNGEGGEFSATLGVTNEGLAVANIGKHAGKERESPLRICLVQAISRGEKMDYTVQKAVELGVEKIIPVFTKRCGMELDDKRLQNRMRRWRSIVVSACEQCGRNYLPEIAFPLTLLECLPQLPEGLCLVLHPTEGKHVRDLSQRAKRIILFIGPEGGFADEELHLFKQHKIQKLCLGPRVLRTETAGVAAIAALQALLGDL